MLIRQHGSQYTNGPAEKTTITRFNQQRSEKPNFYKIKAGDHFDVWSTIRAFNCSMIPVLYGWNGFKLIKINKGGRYIIYEVGS